MSSDAALVTLSGVTRTFVMGEVRVPVLRGVDLEIPAKRLTVLLGPSGSGKTTLLNLLGGIDRADTGTVMAGGRISRRSPTTAGRIQPIGLTEGDAVTAGQVVAGIEHADLDTAVVMAEARVRHEPLTGRVSRIEPRGFTKVSSLGVEQQRVLVIVDFDPDVLEQFAADGYTLGVGYRLQVRVITDTHENAVVVPRSALFRGTGDRWQVFVVHGNRARLADVRIGLLNDHEVEIVGGISANDIVVIAPETDLLDGARVTLH